jgi:hypothetical protein
MKLIYSNKFWTAQPPIVSPIWRLSYYVFKLLIIQINNYYKFQSRGVMVEPKSTKFQIPSLDMIKLHGLGLLDDFGLFRWWASTSFRPSVIEHLYTHCMACEALLYAPWLSHSPTLCSLPLPKPKMVLIFSLPLLHLAREGHR